MYVQQEKTEAAETQLGSLSFLSAPVGPNYMKV